MRKEKKEKKPLLQVTMYQTPPSFPSIFSPSSLSTHPKNTTSIKKFVRLFSFIVM